MRIPLTPAAAAPLTVAFLRYVFELLFGTRRAAAMRVRSLLHR